MDKNEIKRARENIRNRTQWRFHYFSYEMVKKISGRSEMKFYFKNRDIEDLIKFPENKINSFFP